MALTAFRHARVDLSHAIVQLRHLPFQLLLQQRQLHGWRAIGSG
jgi:hypothetical protein